MQEIKSEWEKGKAWIDNYTRDFPELDTLADGVSLHNSRNAPMVGDVTLAGDIRQIPRASVQQMPVFSATVNGTKLSVDALVLSYLLRANIFNPDTFGDGILATAQLAGESALTRGFQALRANTNKIFNQFGTTLEALHYNDIVIEPGVFDASDSSYYHVRTRVTKSKLKNLLKQAEKNPKTTWNTKMLRELIESDPQADYSHTSPTRGNPANNALQYDIITRYGVGPYYDIVTYSPQLEEPLQEIKSKSKFGFPRVQFLVIDPAQLSPFGISRARLSSPMANYANIYLQSTAKMQLLNADPPTLERGMFNSPVTLKRGARWKSQDPNADVKLMELSNSTLQQFREVLDYTSNQIHTTMGVGTVNPNRSRSVYQNAESVKADNDLRGLGNNQVTMLLESALRQYALTALDLLLSEQSGEEPLVVDDEAKNAINQLEGEGFVGDDNRVIINWEELYDRIDTLTVTVDLSLAKDDIEEKKLGDLQNMATTIRQQSDPNDPEANAKAGAIEDELLQKVAPEVSKQLENYQEPKEPVDTQMM